MTVPSPSGTSLAGPDGFKTRELSGLLVFVSRILTAPVMSWVPFENVEIFSRFISTSI